ncbi:MAG: bacitracin ABC transporter ATP-binding protein, partial [Bacillales bacterium]
QQKIKLRVSDGEEAWRTLLSRGMKVDFKEGAVFLENASDEKAAEAVAVLVENGFAVYRVEEQKSSLEEIFLQMTKGERDK